MSTPSVGPVVDCLVDTNVLLRSVESGHTLHATARQALLDLPAAGSTLGIAAQNLVEFWVVATRPLAVNGLGLTPAQAAAELATFKTAFRLLPETDALFLQWERIATTYDVQGKQAHDARLGAVMKLHGVPRILTFNTADFARYATGENITVVDPTAVPHPSS